MAKSKDWKAPVTRTLRAPTAGPVADFDTGGTFGFRGDKARGEELLAQRGEHLSELQEKLFAHGRSGGTRSVLLVLQGMDTSGKGGVVRHVGGKMDPQGLKIKGFGKPTPEELEHDFLWRIRRELPAPGRVGIFDRSHYEDVLPVRVHDLVPPEQWQTYYDAINDFEAGLVESGTVILKCALMLSKSEQRDRLAERLQRPDKYWKYHPGDIDERAHWDDYLEAYQAIMDRTDQERAPWYLIPADRKWFARLAVCELLIDALEGLDLGWPPADFDVETERARVAALDD